MCFDLLLFCCRICYCAITGIVDRGDEFSPGTGRELKIIEGLLCAKDCVGHFTF